MFVVDTLTFSCTNMQIWLTPLLNLVKSSTHPQWHGSQFPLVRSHASMSNHCYNETIGEDYIGIISPCCHSVRKKEHNLFLWLALWLSNVIGFAHMFPIHESGSHTHYLLFFLSAPYPWDWVQLHWICFRSWCWACSAKICEWISVKINLIQVESYSNIFAPCLCQYHKSCYWQLRIFKFQYFFPPFNFFVL